MDSQLPTRGRWYHQWWGVVLISVTFLGLAFVGLFFGITIKYWWQIKHGIRPEFVNEARRNFTAVGGLSANQNTTVDRKLLETTDSPFLGLYNAPIVIVEFVDFKCPNCKIAAPVTRQLDAAYHNKIKFIARNFPAESIHPGATELAYVAYCAGRQNRFWEMHDVLFNEQDTLPTPLTDDSMKNLAQEVGADYDQLAQCVKADSTKQQVEKDYVTGVSAGVQGTPTFFVNGEKVEGAIPFEVWKNYLDKQ